MLVIGWVTTWKKLTSCFQFLCDIKFEGIPKSVFQKNTFFVFKTFCISYVLWEKYELPHGSSRFGVCCFVFWVFVHFIHVIKNRRYLQIHHKNIYILAYQILLYLLRTMSKMPKTLMDKNLPHALSFYANKDMKISLNLTVTNINVLFSKLFLPLIYLEWNAKISQLN